MKTLTRSRVFAPATVLAYHGVADIDPNDDPHLLLLAPRLFDEHLDLLTRRRYRFRAARDLASDAGVSPDPGTAVLTFDDGWHDGLTTVLPRLVERGITATFFVNPGLFGRQHDLVAGPQGRLLDADDVRALAQAGMEIASHSLEHRDLRQLDDRDLAASLRTSRTRIEDVTGQPCETLAYPFGLHDARVEEAAAAAGYRLAFSWRPGPWRALAAPRLPAPARNGARRLALKLLGIRRRI